MIVCDVCLIDSKASGIDECSDDGKRIALFVDTVVRIRCLTLMLTAGGQAKDDDQECGDAELSRNVSRKMSRKLTGRSSKRRKHDSMMKWKEERGRKAPHLEILERDYIMVPGTSFSTQLPFFFTHSLVGIMAPGKASSPSTLTS